MVSQQTRSLLYVQRYTVVTLRNKYVKNNVICDDTKVNFEVLFVVVWSDGSEDWVIIYCALGSVQQSLKTTIKVHDS